jgi:hypothetical protein
VLTTIIKLLGMTWQDSIGSAMDIVRRIMGVEQTDIQQDQKSRNVTHVLLEDKDFSQRFDENNYISVNFLDNNDMLQQPSNLDLFTAMEPYSMDKGENVLTCTVLPLDSENRSSFIFQVMNWH